MEVQTKNQLSKRKLWVFPWKYNESFIISIGLLIIGFLLELFSNGKGFNSPIWPANIIILLSLIIYIVFTNIFIKHPLIKWMGSVPAAISAIVIFTLLILLMGFIPQNKASSSMLINKLGLNHIVQSYTYVLMSLYLLIILGYATSKRLYPFNFKNFAFLLNHAGLWIVLAAGSLGSGDIIRLKMAVNEKQTVWYAYDETNHPYELPFAIELIDFSIDEYIPNIAFANISDGKIITNKSKQKLPEIIQGKTIIMKDWSIFIDEYYSKSKMVDSSYVLTTDTGATPSAYIIATNKKLNIKKEGWISCGSFKYPQKLIKLDDQILIGMLEPDIKRFSSKIKIYSPNQKVEMITVEVNKPMNIKGWEIYQSGYDKSMGRWSTLSIFEIIKDPWYIVVYIGIIMLIVGSVFLFWHGKYK